MLSMMSSVYASINHATGRSFLLGNLHGTLVSKKSANLIIDTLVEGENRVILQWARNHEKLWRTAPHSLRRRQQLAREWDVPGFSVIMDNVGKVR